MSTLQPGDRVDGRFVVEQVLGEGGLARVYRVRHLDLGATFALKLLLLRKRELAERLVVEGRIQAQLHHPNIVAVIDLVRHEGQLGLLMEYVDHQTLEHYLDRKGALPLLEALGMLAPICSAVVAAHEAGITHRDLKPANVMLAQTPRGLVPKIADFGIAKVVDDAVLVGAAATRMVGTPGYLAPEQITDSSGVDERADLFALGAIAWRVLAGRNAYQDADGQVALEATLSPAPPLRDHAPHVPEHVAAAIHRAMALDRDDRFPDVRSFAAALLYDHPELFDLVDREPSGERTITLDGVAGTVSSVSPMSGAPFAPRAGGETLIAVGTPTFSEVPGVPATVVLDDDVPPSRSTAAGVRIAGAVVGGIVAFVAVCSVALLFLVTRGAPEEPSPEVPVEVAPAEPIPETPAPELPAVAPEVLAPELPAVVPEVPAPVAAPVPVPVPEEVPVPDPVPAPAPEEVAPAIADVDLPDPLPVPAPTPAPAPPAALPDLTGSWMGKANNVPFDLVFDAVAYPDVSATGTFQVGASTQNVALTGTFDGVRLSLAGSGFTFAGTWADGRLTGTYHRGKGKDLAWSVSR